MNIHNAAIISFPSDKRPFCIHSCKFMFIVYCKIRKDFLKTVVLSLRLYKDRTPLQGRRPKIKYALVCLTCTCGILITPAAHPATLITSTAYVCKIISSIAGRINAPRIMYSPVSLHLQHTITDADMGLNILVAIVGCQLFSQCCHEYPQGGNIAFC